MTTEKYDGPDRRNSEEFDEAVKTHISNCAWKTFPFVMSALIATFGWGVTVETRLQNIQTIQSERTVKIAAMDLRMSDIAKGAFDPSPKPETKVAIEALKAEHKELQIAVDRLEDRINGLHSYLLQMPPPKATIPGRRGMMGPFKPDDKG